MNPPIAVELDLAAVIESYEFVTGDGIFDGVHGAEGSEFLDDNGCVFHGGPGLFFLDGHAVPFIACSYQVTRGLT